MKKKIVITYTNEHKLITGPELIVHNVTINYDVDKFGDVSIKCSEEFLLDIIELGNREGMDISLEDDNE